MTEHATVKPEDWVPGQYAPAPAPRLNDPVIEDDIRDMEMPIGSTRKYWICGRCHRWEVPHDVEDCSCRNRNEQEIVFRACSMFDPHVVQAASDDIFDHTDLDREQADALAEKIIKTTYQTMRGPNPWALS